MFIRTVFSFGLKRYPSNTSVTSVFPDNTTLCEMHLNKIPLEYDLSNTLCSLSGGVVTLTSFGGGDGAGAQLQRTMQTFMMAHIVPGLGYIHTPLSILDTHGENRSIMHRWNTLIDLPEHHSHGCTNPKACFHVGIGFARNWSVLCQAAHTACTQAPPHPVTGVRRVVLHTALSPLFDIDPRLLSRAPPFSSLLPWISQSRPVKTEFDNKVNVVIHVRRGDLINATYNNRALANSYYIDISNVIIDALAAARLPLARFTVHMDNVTAELQSTLRLNEFAGIRGDVLFRLGGDPIDAMRAFVGADIFVMSHSSFSYMAALLHDPGKSVVIYDPFWHRARPDWFVVSWQRTKRVEELTRHLMGKRETLIEAGWR